MTTTFGFPYYHIWQHEAGQYVFLNVPAISPLEWHPFSISSPPSALFRSFHIRDMGEGTFTRKLRHIAQKDSEQDDEFPLKATDAGLVLSGTSIFFFQSVSLSLYVLLIRHLR